MAGCFNGRGDAQRGLSRWAESEHDIRHAIELYRVLDDRIEVARATIRHAMVLRDRSWYDKAADVCRRNDITDPDTIAVVLKEW